MPLIFWLTVSLLTVGGFLFTPEIGLGTIVPTIAPSVLTVAGYFITSRFKVMKYVHFGGRIEQIVLLTFVIVNIICFCLFVLDDLPLIGRTYISVLCVHFLGVSITSS